MLAAHRMWRQEHASGSHYDSVVLGDSPLAFWPLNEPSGTSAIDATGNGRTGTYEGTPGTNYTLGQTGIGDGESSVLFDGSSGYVLAHSGFIVGGLALFSIEAWIRTSNAANPDGRGIYCERGTSGNDIVKMEEAGTGAGGAGQVGFTYRDDAGNVTQKHASTAINDGALHHCVVTVNVTTQAIAFYRDGVADGTAPLNNSSTTTLTNTVSATIATDIADQSNASLQGDVAKVAVYNYVLTSTQVAAHYAAA